MPSSSCRFPALLVTLVAGAVLVGCEPLPEEPQPESLEVERQASHAASSGPVSVTVTLEERNGSGISGEATITDDGSTIVVSGTAMGMDPANVFNPAPEDPNEDPTGYLSLFYDKASTPSGPRVCEPGVGPHGHQAHFGEGDEGGLGEDHPLFLTDPQMLGGFWTVDANGDGTLHDIDGAYVPVDEIGTMSIRDLRINGGFGPEAVVACGLVTHDPAN